MYYKGYYFDKICLMSDGEYGTHYICSVLIDTKYVAISGYTDFEDLIKILDELVDYYNSL